jgi:chromosome segregation ATPase
MLDEMGDKHLMADEAVALKKRDLKDLKLEEHERRARLEDLQRAREDMSDLLGRKRDQLARLDEEGNRARAVLSSTKQELRTYREDIAKLGEYERRLRSEISEQREAIRSFREDEARSEEHLHRLARETEMAEREFGSLSHEVRRLDEIDRQVRGDLEHRRHRIEELAHLERQYTRELDHLAHTRVDYSHAVEKLMSVEDRQRHELARSADELHRLERRLTHDPYMPGPGHYGMPPPPPLTGAAFGGPRAYPAITGPIGYAPTTPFVGSRVIATPARGTAVVGTSQVQTQQR